MKNMTLLVAMILSVFLTQSAQAACPSQFASLPLAERCQKAKDALEYGRITQPEINDCCEPPKAQAPVSSGQAVVRPPSPPPRGGVSAEDFAALKAKVDSYHPDANGAVTRKELDDWYSTLLATLIGILIGVVLLAALGYFLFYSPHKAMKSEMERLEAQQLDLSNALVKKGHISPEDLK